MSGREMTVKKIERIERRGKPEYDVSEAKRRVFQGGKFICTELC